MIQLPERKICLLLEKTKSPKSVSMQQFSFKDIFDVVKRISINNKIKIAGLSIIKYR